MKSTSCSQELPKSSDEEQSSSIETCRSKKNGANSRGFKLTTPVRLVGGSTLARGKLTALKSVYHVVSTKVFTEEKIVAD